MPAGAAADRASVAEAIFRLTWAIWAVTAVVVCIIQYGPWSSAPATAAHRQTAAVSRRGPVAGTAKLRADASYMAPAAGVAAAPTSE
jgi:hypothetical protein